MNNIIAIDPALNKTGVAQVYGGELEVYTFRPMTKHRVKRLNEHFHHWWPKLHHRPPDLCILEDYAYATHGGSVMQIGELGGILRLALHWSGVPYVFVNPSTVKMIALGKGGGKGVDKTAVLLAARDRLGYEGKSNDEADARWLLELAFQHYGHPLQAKLPKTHTRALAKVAWPGEPLI